MGVDVYLICHDCKRRAFAYKNYPSPTRLEINNIAKLFELHRNDGCWGPLNLIDDTIPWPDELFAYELIENIPNKEQQ